MCYLGDLDRAEEYTQFGLRREETVVRPYCLYMLAEARRAQGRLGEAEQFGKEAIAAGEALQDPRALGPAWRALGKTYHAAGRLAESRHGLAQVVQIYRQLGVAAEVEHSQQLLAELASA